MNSIPVYIFFNGLINISMKANDVDVTDYGSSYPIFSSSLPLYLFSDSTL
jgi:hypothetical protein